MRKHKQEPQVAVLQNSAARAPADAASPPHDGQKRLASSGASDGAGFGAAALDDLIFEPAAFESAGAARSVSALAPALGLVAAALIAFFSTWFLLSPAVAWVDRGVVTALVVGNVVIAAGLAILIGARLWHVISNRRNRLAGSRTHLRLVGAFLVVSAAPALFAFLFAFTMLRSSLNDVFSDRIESNVNTARGLANNYFNAEAQDDFENLVLLEADLARNKNFGLTAASSPILFRLRLAEQALGRQLAAIFILNADRQIISRVEMIDGAFAMPPKSVFDRIDEAAALGRPESERGHYAINDLARLDHFRSILKSDLLDGGYIVIYRPIPAAVADSLRDVRTMRDDWQYAKDQRARLERVFLAGYVIMALIILLGAIWAALQAATRIVKPIGSLVSMAEQVSSGDLSARVRVDKRDGELGVLASAMNRMTTQLDSQRADLIETNRRFDQRRRFTEAVLAGVPAGVVGVSSDGLLTIANRSAEDLLKIDAGRAIGAPLTDFAPEMAPLLNEARTSQGAEVSGQLEFERDGRMRTINVRIVRDESEGARSYVATFDDLTELIAAQRSAAWGDVARRIAHEIKNPLTPIQLSAERLRRKYQGEIASSPEVFDKCTETIIRHVNDIGRMVDEFSSFARMPKPVIGGEDLIELAKSAIFTQRVAFPEIDFELTTDMASAPVRCDGRLIVQALGNVLKNACESIDARLVDRPEPRGRIQVRLLEDGEAFDLHVVDNGVGLPKAERHRLTEPYMTTRTKGTGLGLAIVKKVIEEHDGTLDFHDEHELGPSGACVRIILPRDPERPADDRDVKSAAEALSSKIPSSRAASSRATAPRTAAE